eukprot:4628608-Heterocapsa_arctica.AAC.1
MSGQTTCLHVIGPLQIEDDKFYEMIAPVYGQVNAQLFRMGWRLHSLGPLKYVDDIVLAAYKTY